MGVVSDSAQRFDIPGEPGEWVELFALTHFDYQAAIDENQRLGRLQAAEWGTAYDTLMERGERQRAKGVTVRSDPFATHNTMVMLERGVCRWSYPIHLSERSSNQSAQKERIAALARLEKQTVEYIVRQLLANGHIDNAWGKDTGESNDVIDVIAQEVGDEDQNPTNVVSSSRWIG